MSLTREEWCKMWESIKTIENLVLEGGYPRKITNSKGEIILYECEMIKNQIQRVIGQME